MNFNNETAIFNCTPAQIDYSATFYTFNFCARDEHYLINGNSCYSFKLYIHNSTIPQRNAVVPLNNKTITENYPSQFNFPQDLFTDVDGDPLTYSISSSPSASGFLNFNASTRIFTANPIISSHAGTYTITITATDDDSNTANDNFDLIVIANGPPELDLGLGGPVEAIVYYPFSYTIPERAFIDQQGEAITIKVAMDPADYILNLNDTSKLITFTPDDNAKAGPHNIIFTVNDIWNITQPTFNLSLNIIANGVPSILREAKDPSWILEDYQFDYTIVKSWYSDPENENITFSYSVDSPTLGSWVSMTQNSTHIFLNGRPDTSHVGSFTLSLIIADIHGGQITDDIAIWVEADVNPQHFNSNTKPNDPPSAIAGYDWEYVYSLKWFKGFENVNYYDWAWDITPSNSYFTCYKSGRKIYFIGNQDANLGDNQYTLIINRTKSSDPSLDLILQLKFTVFDNLPPTLLALADQTVEAPNSLVWSYGSKIAADPESYIVDKYVLVDGSSAPGWLSYDLSEFSFNIASTTNAMNGTYIVSIVIVDGINQEARENFTLVINYTPDPIKQMTIPNYIILNYKHLLVTFKGNYSLIFFTDLNTLFVDPNTLPMTSNVIQADGTPLPSFLTFTSANNSLEGDPTSDHIGSWNLKYSAVNSNLNEGSINFKIKVEGN